MTSAEVHGHPGMLLLDALTKAHAYVSVVYDLAPIKLGLEIVDQSNVALRLSSNTLKVLSVDLTEGFIRLNTHPLENQGEGGAGVEIGAMVQKHGDTFEGLSRGGAPCLANLLLSFGLFKTLLYSINKVSTDNAGEDEA